MRVYFDKESPIIFYVFVILVFGGFASFILISSMYEFITTGFPDWSVFEWFCMVVMELGWYAVAVWTARYAWKCKHVWVDFGDECIIYHLGRKKYIYSYADLMRVEAIYGGRFGGVLWGFWFKFSDNTKFKLAKDEYIVKRFRSILSGYRGDLI